MTMTMPTVAHILVVDDEPEIAESLADFLQRKGYRVSTAVTGTEAIHLLEQAYPNPHTAVDLVLLDMRMPDISGLETLAWLRQHQQTSLSFTRVIMLTAASGNREKVEALNAGADDYITKPYHPQELLARVQTLLRTQQLEKQLQQQRAQLAELNRLSHSLSSNLTQPLNEAFQVVADSLQPMLEVEQIGIFVIAPLRESLLCRYLSNTTPSEPAYPPIPLGQGILGQAGQNSQLFYVNELTEHPLFDPRTDLPHGREPISLTAVPISLRGNPWGIIAAFNKQNHKPFTEFDLNLLTTLASSLSNSIENNLLFQRLRDRQQELLDSRNTLQAIIDGILHPIYTINEQWELVAINHIQAQTTQQPIPKLVGRICYEAFFGRTTPCDHCQAHETLHQKQARTWASRWLGDDHLPQEWDINAYPVPAKQAGSASAVIVWQDRTEERRLEQSLLQAGKLAAIGQLAAGVAHEINNPLTVINANAEMLKMTIPQGTDDYEGVDLIHRAGVRAAHVVGGLLDFAREHQYIFVPVDINQSLKQALELVTYQMNVAHVTVSLELAHGLPPVAASSEHIKSVWINLLVNARDALRDANTAVPLIHITTRLLQQEHPAEPTIQIIIQDNGPGIPPAEAVHIFEPFYTTKDPGKGTGLGLATCLRIIKQHGGSIEMLSPPDGGATFVIQLPSHNEQPTNFP
jgi:two-component system, NtrC family, sensor kinase